MRLDINLATQPYQDSQEFWRRWGAGIVVLGVVSALLVGFTLWSVYGAYKDRQALESLRQGIAADDAKIAYAEAIMAKPENRTLRERSTYLNGLFLQKAFSWTKVFEDLEQVMPPRLHVVSIKPDTTKESQLQLKLVVAGDSRDRALDLVRKMEDSSRFRATRIDQETSRISPIAGEEIQFDITAQYAGESGFAREGIR